MSDTPAPAGGGQAAATPTSGADAGASKTSSFPSSSEAPGRKLSARESFGRDLPDPPPAAASGSQESSKEPAKETPAQKKWRLKVDGAEVDYDASDETKVQRDIQKALAADKRLQEAATTKRGVERFLEALRANPLKTLLDPRLGIDPKVARQTAEALLREQIEEEMLSPEDRAARDKDAELERYRAAEKARKDTEAGAEYQKLLTKAEQAYTAKFQEALAATGLPVTPHTLRRIAVYQRYCNQNGIKVTPGELAAKVRQDYIDEHAHVFGQLDGDKLLEHFGDQTATKIREADLKRHRPRNPDGTFQGQTAPKGGNPPSQQRAGSQQTERPHEWLNKIRGQG